MKMRRVVFSDAAQTDILDLETWIERETGKKTARRYVDRLFSYCLDLNLASERGSVRDDLVRGLRIIGFEKNVTIAFVVTTEEVEILRIFSAGRDWETAFLEE